METGRALVCFVGFTINHPGVTGRGVDRLPDVSAVISVHEPAYLYSRRIQFRVRHVHALIFYKFIVIV